MEQLKELLVKLFRAEPYTKERYDIIKQIEKIENELKVYTYFHGLDEENKTIIADIQAKEKGLYKTIEEFKIDNIKLFRRDYE